MSWIQKHKIFFKSFDVIFCNAKTNVLISKINLKECQNTIVVSCPLMVTA